MQGLADAKVVHGYDRDAAETKEWIMEKDTAVSSEDYGHDLASVQALVRRHEGFEVGKLFFVLLPFCHSYVCKHMTYWCGSLDLLL